MTVEFADGGRRNPFPPEWGRPVGEPFSEVRAAWVRDRVRQHLGDVESRQSAATQFPRLQLMLRELQMRHELRQAREE